MTPYNPTYSLATSGAKTRLLATTTAADGIATTATLVTLPKDTARTVADLLGQLHSNRSATLADFAAHNPGQVCYLRRAFMAALTDASRDLGPTMTALRDAVAGLSDAEHRAVRDELGRLYDGTEDILVAVVLTDEFGWVTFRTTANAWLQDEAAPDADGSTVLSDDELITLVAYTAGGIQLFDRDCDASDLLYEGLLAHLRSTDAEIDEAADRGWIDVELNGPGLRAWLARHRPDLTAEIDDVIDGTD